MRVGKHQLRVLMSLGSPLTLMLTSDRSSHGLVNRGLLRQRNGASCITPAGLRLLADEMQAGRVDDALTGIEKERAEREARKAKGE